MLTLYGDHRSGNCYKVELLLAQLGRSYRFVDVDVLRGQTRRYVRQSIRFLWCMVCSSAILNT